MEEMGIRRQWSPIERLAHLKAQRIARTPLRWVCHKIRVEREHLCLTRSAISYNYLRLPVTCFTPLKVNLGYFGY